jgi:hypothetical protein
MLTGAYWKMKAKCPTCGIEGFVEQRGNSYRIKHYAGYNGNQRKYVIHTLSKDFINILGINGNQNLGITDPYLNPISRKKWTDGDLNPRPPECKSGVHTN